MPAGLPTGETEHPRSLLDPLPETVAGSRSPRHSLPRDTHSDGENQRTVLGRNSCSHFLFRVTPAIRAR